jgi:hypothetical protein
MEVRYLRELLRLARIAKYGPGSEQLSDEQLELFELEPGVRTEEVQAESERAQLKLPLRPARKEGHGRQSLPAHLPRVETIVSKYLDHLPLYWQSAILLRDTGSNYPETPSVIGSCGWANCSSPLPENS